MKSILSALLTSVMMILCFEARAVQDTAQKPADDKKVIRMLLKERKERFAQYTEHIDDRSGFFGNQTKKDLQQINEVLKEIVRTDNKIIMELDRLLDQRRFETFRSHYETKRAGQELVELQMQNEKLISANDTLIKQLQACCEPGSSGSTGNSRTIYIFFTYFFGAILLFMLLLKWKRPTAKS